MDWLIAETGAVSLYDSIVILARRAKLDGVIRKTSISFTLSGYSLPGLVTEKKTGILHIVWPDCCTRPAKREVHKCLGLKIACLGSPSHQCRLHLFPASVHLTITASHVFGPMPKACPDNQDTLVFNDRYTNLTMAILALNISSMPVASFLVNHWETRYAEMAFLLTNTGP